MLSENCVAVSKVFTGNSKEYKHAREKLNPGKYDVDTILRVKGILTVGEDSLMTPTTSLLNQEFFMLVLKYAGVTRDMAATAMVAVANEYLKDWGGDSSKKSAKRMRQAKVEEFDPDGKIREIFSSFKESLPKIKKSGSVTWNGTVEEVAQEIVPVASTGVDVSPVKKVA